MDIDFPGWFRAIKANIESFEANAEDKGDYRFECSADDMQTLGWVRVICDLVLADLASATPAPTRKPA